MPILDYDRILNGSPSKILRRKHVELVETYTEESAKQYSTLYMEQPLSFLLENSRYIFSEPTYGYNYYVEKVLSDDSVYDCVMSYPEEMEKVNAYLEENKSSMGSELKEMYESLLTKLTDKAEKSSVLRSFISYESENYGSTDPLTSDSTLVYMTTMPLKMANATDEEMKVLHEKFNDLSGLCLTESTNEEDWKSVFEAAVAAGKLQHDALWCEFVDSYTSPQFRNLIDALAKESISYQIESVATTTEKDSTFRMYATPQYAVESIFDIVDDSELFEEQFANDRKMVDNLQGYAYQLIRGLIMNEYNESANSDELIEGYLGVFPANTTIEEAVKLINETCDSYDFITEASDPGQPSDVVRNDAGGYIHEDEPRKKATPPTSRSAANKLTMKAMDFESGYYRKKAKASERGEGIRQAAKAVSAVPKDVKDDIDKTVSQWDEADDERRKRFMTKPGFRKNLFKKLKLALMYSAAGSANLLLVPVVAVCRHWSKQKDKRIQTELVRELDAEIKICDEKINDAGSAGDNTNKYKLMRIKSKLEAEKFRVMTNSKYV